MSHGGGRILIVDDEPSVLKMMGVYLGRLGYSVTTTNSTQKAWAQVEAAPSDYAIAVLDGSMPGLSMEDLALKMLRANPSLCVVAASGYSVDTSAMDAVAPGRVAVLPKPFTPEMLAATVRRMLAAQKEKL
ncbi:MAG: response regulator [Bryobacteraceae bacterium]|jgi:DNA-binding NtrC family response regulator